MTLIERCDIAVEGTEGRPIRDTWGERLIHYGTRTGWLGCTLAPVLLVGLLLLWPNPWALGIVAAWGIVSYLKLEGRTLWDHAYMYVIGGELGRTAVAVEAYIGPGMVHTRPKTFPANMRIFRPRNLTDDQRGRIVTELDSRVGQPYSMKANIMFGLDYVLGLGLWDAYVFRRWFLTDDDLVCSYYAAIGLWIVMEWATGYDFGVDHWRQISPDTIADFCGSHPEYYELVLERRDGEQVL